VPTRARTGGDTPAPVRLMALSEQGKET
jgi:hypothetical protein